MELAKPQALDSWRLGGIGILRAVFGIVWGIDARYKWQPSVWTPGGLDRDRRGPATLPSRNAWEN